MENISLFHSVLDEALERLGKKNLKLKECQYEAVKAVVVDRKDTICILPTGYGKSLIYQLLLASSLLRLIESIYLQPMRSTGDIQFFVCRSRIIPEPPSQGIAGSGNEIATSFEIEILPLPKKKSKSEVAMEELLDEGKSSNSSGEPTGQVESRAEKNRRIDREILQLSNEVPIGLTEDLLMWWEENPLVRNFAARVLAAPPTSVPSEQILVGLDLLSQRNVPRLSQPLSTHLYF